MSLLSKSRTLIKVWRQDPAEARRLIVSKMPPFLRDTGFQIANPFQKKPVLTFMDKVARYLNDLPGENLTIIDIGCHGGSFWEELAKKIAPSRRVFSIGIDPVRLEFAPALYSMFLEIALADGPESQRDFYVYEDAQCNSLRKMKNENITHDIAEKDSKWFVARSIEELREVKKVRCRPLSDVIEELGLAGQIIHYMKIDAQGDDLSVVKSAGKYLDDMLFVQMESVTSHNPDITLYEDQPLFEEEKKFMTAHGFTIFDMEDHAATASPEADVVYINKALANKLTKLKG